jgi:hypothetical protein
MPEQCAAACRDCRGNDDDASQKASVEDSVYREMMLEVSNRKSPRECDEYDTSEDCDAFERCPVWEEEDECIRSPKEMKVLCPEFCKQLPRIEFGMNMGACTDHHLKCSHWKAIGECDVANNYMGMYCPKACGVCKNRRSPEEMRNIVNDHMMKQEQPKEEPAWINL